VIRGRINRWNGKYGFIILEGQHIDTFFHKDDTPGLTENDLREGLEVTCEVRQQGGKSRAINVRAIVPPVQPQGEYRFLNPYNFVRFLNEPTILPTTPITQQLLGRCMPPPHDRWVGLSGQLICKLTADSLLFVSDSERVEERQNGHKAYSFFQLDGKAAIPATTLRGVIRSVFEAVTNSCLSSFQEDKYPLEYREAHSPDFIPVRVIELCNDGSALLERLDCTQGLPSGVSTNGKPNVMMTGAVKAAYPPRVLQTNGNWYNERYSSLRGLPADRDGLRVAAIVSKQPIEHARRPFSAFEVIEVVPASQASTLQLQMSPNHIMVYGWLHATGPNIENKHDERLFFRWETNPNPKSNDELKNLHLAITCSKEGVAEYNQHLAEYWHRHAKGASKVTLPQLSVFVTPGRKLKVGDLVYYFEDHKDGVSIDVLRAVTIPRRRYRTKRQELLPEFSHKCREYDKLCPACRTFGWVSQNTNDVSSESHTAYASRVRFGNAILSSDAGVESEISLAVLGSPKPTTTRFYLRPKSRRPADGEEDCQVDYDADDVTLRGRKFYRHHNAMNPGEYTRMTDQDHDGIDDKSRTIIDARKPGNAFKFTVDFENLSEVELGALLWSIQLEQGMHHRLGYAKPLGFGSVHIEVQDVAIFDPLVRYGKDLESGWEKKIDQITNWITTFENAISMLYRHRDDRFNSLENVADLRTLLSAPINSLLPIHYPRSQPEPQAEGKNFEWFVGNKRSGKYPGPRLVLPLAEDDRRGIRLVDRDGELK